MTFVACALGAIYSHYSALYLVATLGLVWLAMTIQISNLGFRISSAASLLQWRALRPGALGFSVVAAGVAASAPHWLSSMRASQAYWPGRLDVISALANGMHVMIDGHAGMPEAAGALVILCGILALSAMLGTAASPSGHRGLLLVLLISLVGMTLTFAVLYLQPQFEPRRLASRCRMTRCWT
jgi:hypothetical protein